MRPQKFFIFFFCFFLFPSSFAQTLPGNTLTTVGKTDNKTDYSAVQENHQEVIFRKANSVIGNWDDQFDTKGLANPKVWAVAVNGNDIYVGGEFAEVGGIQVNNVAKWDGNEWSSLGGGVTYSSNARVFAITIIGEDVYVAGQFSSAGGVPVNNIAKWNGSEWESLGDGLSDFGGNSCLVFTLATDGLDLYAGGNFAVSGQIPVGRLGKWDGMTWSEIGGGVNSIVNSIVIDNDHIYVGGYLSYVGSYPDGMEVSNIAVWDGAQWSDLDGGTLGQVKAMTFSNGNLYVGGVNVKAGDLSDCMTARWDGSSWHALGYDLFFSGEVLCMENLNGDIYVGSYSQDYSPYPGVDQPARIAKWNGSEWSFLGDGIGISYVNSIAAGENDLCVGGIFTEAGGLSVSNLAGWNGSEWYDIGGGVSGGGLAEVNAIEIVGNNVYVGGNFTEAGGVRVDHLAKWDGKTWSTVGSGVSPYGWVTTLDFDGKNLYVGGAFKKAGNMSAWNLAGWDGTGWSSIGNGVNSAPRDIVIKDNDIYVGGSFNLAGGSISSGGILVNHIARWNGVEWSPLGTGVRNWSVISIASFGDYIYMGSWEANAGDLSGINIARWDGSNWTDVGGGVNDLVFSLVSNGANLYVGGGFYQAGNIIANHIAVWNGKEWSNLGEGIPYWNSWVNTICLSDQDVYAGGSFLEEFGDPGNNIAKWDGSDWYSLGQGVNSNVNTIEVAGHNVFVGGVFNEAGGNKSMYFGRWIEEPDNNELPVAFNDTVTVKQGDTIAIDVLKNDNDPDGDLIRISDVTHTSNGHISITNELKGDLIYYTSSHEFAGLDSLIYIIEDGLGGISSAKVIINVQQNTTLVHDLNSDDLLTIYPVPANNLITLRYNGSYNNAFDLTICNLFGKQLFSVESITLHHQRDYSQDISFLEPGVYLLILEGNSIRLIEKFTVVK